MSSSILLRTLGIVGRAAMGWFLGCNCLVFLLILWQSRATVISSSFLGEWRFTMYYQVMIFFRSFIFKCRKMWEILSHTLKNVTEKELVFRIIFGGITFVICDFILNTLLTPINSSPIFNKNTPEFKSVIINYSGNYLQVKIY